MPELARQFLQRTLGELVTLRKCLDACVAGNPGASVELERMVHKINGTGRTFGFELISECAARLEQLANAAARGPIRDRGILDRLETGMQHLAAEVERSAQAAGLCR
ncbi:MAG TPA: Hpt domain-containing protein [Steroidobacteraceae bacterium]